MATDCRTHPRSAAPECSRRKRRVEIVLRRPMPRYPPPRRRQNAPLILLTLVSWWSRSARARRRFLRRVALRLRRQRSADVPIVAVLKYAPLLDTSAYRSPSRGANALRENVPAGPGPSVRHRPRSREAGPSPRPPAMLDWRRRVSAGASNRSTAVHARRRTTERSTPYSASTPPAQTGRRAPSRGMNADARHSPRIRSSRSRVCRVPAGGRARSRTSAARSSARQRGAVLDFDSTPARRPAGHGPPVVRRWGPVPSGYR